MDLARLLPTKVFCCLNMHPGAMILMSLIILFRFIAMILGCFYGPYLYLVLPLGGLYLAADALLFYAVNTALAAFKEEIDEEIDEDASYKFPQKVDSAGAADDETTSCDFPTVKIWIAGWLAMDLVGVVGLAVCIGLFADLGTWSMTHTPIHM